MRIQRAGAVGMLLVACTVTLVASAATQPRAPGGVGGPQEAEVVGVLIEPQSGQPVIVLQGKRDGRQVAMSIGHFEARGIAVPLQGVTPPRPLTHDLILNLLTDFKATLRRIVITDLRDDVYYALLHLTVQGSERTVDSRPSDAIALALRAKVPILVEERVFDKVGRTMPKASPHF